MSCLAKCCCKQLYLTARWTIAVVRKSKHTRSNLCCGHFNDLSNRFVQPFLKFDLTKIFWTRFLPIITRVCWRFVRSNDSTIFKYGYYKHIVTKLRQIFPTSTIFDSWGIWHGVEIRNIGILSPYLFVQPRTALSLYAKFFARRFLRKGRTYAFTCKATENNLLKL